MLGAVRNPHVTRLHFEIRSDKETAYENPEPLIFEAPLGRFDARDGKLLVEPADHFADEAAARSVIEPFLRSWEIETDLDANPGTIRFKFHSADLVDRDPPPLGSDLSIQLTGESLLITGGTIETLITRRKYPPPPTAFEATVDVARAHARWLDYRAGKSRCRRWATSCLLLSRPRPVVEKAPQVFFKSTSRFWTSSVSWFRYGAVPPRRGRRRRAACFTS